MVRVSLDSASSPQSLRPGLRLGPLTVSSTVAPGSLLSTMARQSTRSAGISRPCRSVLVRRRPSCTSGLHSSGYVLSLRPSVPMTPSGSFITLAPPLSSVTLAPLRPLGSTPWLPAVSALPRTSGSSPSLFGYSFTASGSSSTCSATPGSAPLSQQPFLLQAPPVAAPSFLLPGFSLLHHLTGLCLHTLFIVTIVTAQDSPSERREYCHTPGLFCCVFAPCVP